MIETKHIIAKDFGDNHRVYSKDTTFLGEIYKENGVFKFWPNGNIQGYTVSVMSEIVDVIAHLSLPWEDKST